ncbi:hypothetical protein, partial [Enterobacter hormaechei]
FFGGVFFFYKRMFKAFGVVAGFAVVPAFQPGLVVGFYHAVDEPGGVFVVISFFVFKLRGGGLFTGNIFTCRPANKRAAGQCFLLTSGKNVFLICPHVVQP